MCQASANPSDRFCVLNVSALDVIVTGADGKPAQRALLFDRCGLPTVAQNSKSAESLSDNPQYARRQVR
jgi:hypothetical protein